MNDLMNREQVIELISRVFDRSARTVASEWMRRADFPKPAVTISRTSKAWRRADIEAFLGLEVERG